MKKTINIEMSNNQALHLWGMMASYIHDTTNELKRVGLFTEKGELKKNRKVELLPPVRQEQLDNLALAELLLKDLEKKVDFSKIKEGE